MKTDKLLALVLSVSVAASFAGCGKSNSAETAPDSNLNASLGQDKDVEVNVAEVHMNSYEASTTGNWEAMFVPIEVEGRAIDYAKLDLTPTAEELAAMEKEPAYGKPV